MNRLVVYGRPMRGYANWLLHEWHDTDGDRGFDSRYFYLVPDDVAAEMLKKGAKIDCAGGPPSPT